MYDEKTNKYYGYIYCICNKNDNKMYIGQTIRTIERRIKSHKYSSKNMSRSLYLYSEINKYSWDLFTVHEVEKIVCDSLNELKMKLDEKEIYYISYYNTLYPNGYNISKGGWILPNTFDSCKVYKFDLDGSFISEYDSISDAAINNNISQSDISNCCNGKKLLQLVNIIGQKQKSLY